MNSKAKQDRDLKAPAMSATVDSMESAKSDSNNNNVSMEQLWQSWIDSMPEGLLGMNISSPSDIAPCNDAGACSSSGIWNSQLPSPLSPEERGSDMSPGESFFETDGLSINAISGLDSGAKKERRKAQNRAAQRAFRERKDKRACDLQSEITRLKRTVSLLENENEDFKNRLRDAKTEVEILRSLLPYTRPGA